MRKTLGPALGLALVGLSVAHAMCLLVVKCLLQFQCLLFFIFYLYIYIYIFLKKPWRYEGEFYWSTTEKTKGGLKTWPLLQTSKKITSYIMSSGSSNHSTLTSQDKTNWASLCAVTLACPRIQANFEPGWVLINSLISSRMQPIWEWPSSWQLIADTPGHNLHPQSGVISPKQFDSFESWAGCMRSLP